VIDARGQDDLERAARELRESTEVHALAGDVTDAAHRHALMDAAGRIDLLGSSMQSAAGAGASSQSGQASSARSKRSQRPMGQYAPGQGGPTSWCQPIVG
jgi:hypothetical protein